MLDVKRNRLDGITFDESPHTGGKITPRFIVMHYTAGGSALNSVRAGCSAATEDSRAMTWKLCAVRAVCGGRSSRAIQY